MEVINPPGTLICTRCGHPNAERAFFCSNCGAPVGSKAGQRGYYYDGLPLISLLVTIFGFFIAGFIGPLIGVVLAHVSIRRQNRRGEFTNRGLAIASLVIGYLMLLLGLILMIALGVFVGASLFNHGWMYGHWNYM